MQDKRQVSFNTRSLNVLPSGGIEYNERVWRKWAVQLRSDGLLSVTISDALHLEAAE